MKTSMKDNQTTITLNSDETFRLIVDADNVLVNQLAMDLEVFLDRQRIKGILYLRCGCIIDMPKGAIKHCKNTSNKLLPENKCALRWRDDQRVIQE